MEEEARDILRAALSGSGHRPAALVDSIQPVRRHGRSGGSFARGEPANPQWQGVRGLWGHPHRSLVGSGGRRSDSQPAGSLS